MSTDRAAVVVLIGLLGLAAALLFPGQDAASPAQAAPSAAAPLAPLSADGEVVSLPVEGFDGARASLPLGATSPRPIAIVLHADAESADQHCKVWRGITRAQPFVLCPQLAPKQAGEAVEQQLREALRALKSRFGDYIASGSVVLIGFGSGADHAVQIARQEPTFFARLALVDGGYASFSATAAGAYKQRGGQRVLFVCSSDTCRQAVEPKVTVTRSLDLPAMLLYRGELPSAFDPLMVAALGESYSWLVANEPLPQRIPNPREKPGK